MGAFLSLGHRFPKPSLHVSYVLLMFLQLSRFRVEPLVSPVENLEEGNMGKQVPLGSRLAAPCSRKDAESQFPRSILLYLRNGSTWYHQCIN